MNYKPPARRDKGVINMIFGEESMNKDSIGKRKAHICPVFSISTSRHPQHHPVTFTLEDEEGMSYPHDDPIVFMADIDGFMVKKILVDSGSSYNVLT